MPITFACEQCGSKLEAKPWAAGKRLACPRCKSSVKIPDEDDFFDSIVEHELPAVQTTRALALDQLRDPDKACPYCSTVIPGSALKCPSCHEYLDDRLRKRRLHEATGGTTSAVEQQSDGLAALASLLIPGAGQLYKGHFFTGALYAILVPVGYFALVVPGFLLHGTCIAHAYVCQPASKK